MAAPRFGEWKFWEEGEPAPEGLLPCGYVQYRWVLNYQWPVDDDWFGVTGRLFSYIGNIEIGTDFVSEDRVVFVCTCLGLTPTLVIWTYYPGTLQTTGPETCETFGGPQLDWQYGDLGDVGIGIDTLFIEGNLVSPIYKLNLPADAQITDLMLRPQYAIAGAWELQVRTAPGKVAEPVLIIDNVSGDQHSLALHGDVLVDRRWLSAYRAWDGPRDGLEVTAGTGSRHRVCGPGACGTGGGGRGGGDGGHELRLGEGSHGRAARATRSGGDDGGDSAGGVPVPVGDRGGGAQRGDGGGGGAGERRGVRRGQLRGGAGRERRAERGAGHRRRGSGAGE